MGWYIQDEIVFFGSTRTIVRVVISILRFYNPYTKDNKLIVALDDGPTARVLHVPLALLNDWYRTRLHTFSTSKVVERTK